MPSPAPPQSSVPETPSAATRVARALPPVVLWAGILFLVLRVPPDGKEHGDLGQFFGRFHPLMVHLPVALLVLVPLMELLGRTTRLSHLRPAAGSLLSLAAFLSYFTALDGWLLAWSGGYRGHDVTVHMWVGVAFAAACGLAARVRCADAPRFAYPTLLCAAFALMVWAAHYGGSITRGDGYLTDKLPQRARALFGMAAVAAKEPAAESVASAVPLHAGPGSADPANPAYYAVHIAPLFARSCVSCHRADKHKGGLRMDSYAALMRGGADGAAVEPGNIKASELLRRLKLPASDDDSMPSDGDKPLTPEEIQMVEHWIAAGAKG
jgi:mono/diheme cytochrome c family protein